MPFKVLVTHYDVPERGLEILRQNGCELIINEEKPSASYDEIKKKIPGVDAVFLVTKHKVDAALIAAAGPQLKVLGTMSAGFNHIDVAELKRRKVLVSNTPDVVSAPTANCAILLALAAGRRMLEAREQIFKENWTYGPQWLLGYDLTGSTIGIVGFGGIGQAIAKRLKSFDIKELLYSGPREKPEAAALDAKFASLDDLVSKSDFVFIAAPLTEKTKYMFNKTLFAKMKRTSILVNIARGELVNQDDLIEALQTKQIFAAGLDVMYPEPLPKDHMLLKLPNCVVIPHIGTATYAARTSMAELCANNIIEGLKGKPLLTPL